MQLYEYIHTTAKCVSYKQTNADKKEHTFNTNNI